MKKVQKRYDRNIKLFGKRGQLKLRQVHVVIVGVGGLGSPLAQHLGLLGVGTLTLIDDEELDETNRNRFIGARNDDLVPGSPKVLLVERLVNEINPDVKTNALIKNLVSEEAFKAIKKADWVFGCFDKDGPRAILNELCQAYKKPYIDLASDVDEDGAYGGRVCVMLDANGCLHCLGLLDQREINHYLSTEEELTLEAKIYGIRKNDLQGAGPSVSPINGVVASIAATEFMVGVTGLRKPTRLANYEGRVSKVFVNTDEPGEDCHYCKSVYGEKEKAMVERFLKIPHLRKSRN